MKLRKVEKGMTLVEIIVATAVFSIACSVLFTSILFAIRTNKESYFAGEEIQMQMNTAENYDDKKTMFDNKVTEHRIDGSNEVSLWFDWTTDANGNTTGNASLGEYAQYDCGTVYAYNAIAGYEDRNAFYNMKFFEPEDAKAYDPDSGKFWVIFRNYGSFQLESEVYVNESIGVNLYDEKGKYIGSHYPHVCLNDTSGAVSYQFGLSLENYPGSGSIFVYGDWNHDYYNNPSYIFREGLDLELDESNLDYFCQYNDDGELTGYMEIYFDGEEYLNKADMKSKHPEFTIR